MKFPRVRVKSLKKVMEGREISGDFPAFLRHSASSAGSSHCQRGGGPV